MGRRPLILLVVAGTLTLTLWVLLHPAFVRIQEDVSYEGGTVTYDYLTALRFRPIWTVWRSPSWIPGLIAEAMRR